MVERHAPIWRRILAWLFLILFCLTAPLALAAGWARVTVLTTESYAAVVGGLATDAEVQEAIAHHAGALVAEGVRGEDPTATAALLAEAAGNTVSDAVRDVVASEAFAGIWREAHHALHAFLVITVDAPWGQPAVLDLSPALPLVQEALDERQIELPEGVTIEAEDLRIRLLDAPTADAIRRNAQRLALGSWALLGVASLALVLAIAVAPDRLLALARAGFGMAIAMIALIVLLLVGQQAVMNAAGTASGGEVIGAILDASTQGLRISAVALVLLGLLLAGIFYGLCALRGSTRRHAAAE